MSTSLMLPRVSELLATVNLTDAQDKKIGALSGGMRQRVGIVQAGIHLWQCGG